MRANFHDDNIPGLEGQQQHLLDIGQEDVAVHCSVVDKRRGHSCQAQRTGECRCFPMAVRQPARQRSPRIGRSRSRAIFVERPVVYEDHLLRIEIKPLIKPGASTLQDVRSVLLQCVCGLFLNVHPRPRSQAPSALRLVPTCRSTERSSTILSSVTSRRSSIISTTNASRAS